MILEELLLKETSAPPARSIARSLSAVLFEPGAASLGLGRPEAVIILINTASATDAIVNGVDVADTEGDTLIVDLTADTRDSKHRTELVRTLGAIDGVVIRNVGDSTFLAHVGGKITTASKYPIHNQRNLTRVSKILKSAPFFISVLM